MSAQTTVICAVWHGERERDALLAGHADNLDAQSQPVERIYVFDGADAPPPRLAGEQVVLSRPVSLYEAWNVALSLVRTPYVMNLNLDDRLAPDAVAALESAALAGAELVSGDWRVCYSQAETDSVAPCFPAAELPFVGGWPVAPGTRTRLGSSLERDTHGPACLWRLALHEELPRYPWRFDDRTPVQSCGDWLFWKELERRKKRIARLATVIGNYHSHPGDQAEFRLRGRDDLARGITAVALP